MPVEKGDENAVGKVKVEKATEEEVEDDTEEEAQKGRITGSSSFQLVSSLTESSWAAVNRRSLQRHTQKKMTSITTTTATIPRTHPSALPPLPAVPTGLPLGESHPSPSSPSRTLRQLLITSALTPSSPRAARRPPISSTRVASRTVGGSP